MLYCKGNFEAFHRPFISLVVLLYLLRDSRIFSALISCSFLTVQLIHLESCIINLFKIYCLTILIEFYLYLSPSCQVID